MAKANNYGVENIKRGLNVVAGIVKTSFSADSNQDGKIDGSERTAYLVSVLPQTLPLFGIYGGIVEEIKDKITAEEREELVDFTVSLDFLPDGRENAEEYVKTVMLWLNYNIQFANKSIQFFAKSKAA